jgi:hypothetical protein
MAEKDTIFSSKMKYNGIVEFSKFYKFCYDWLTEEVGLDVAEEKYVEKIDGNAKNIDIEWIGTRKMTDYFKFDVKVTFQILGLTQLEIVQEGKKVKANKGSVEIKIKGILVRDYQGKFEVNATRKFFRGVYEKWVIPSRIEEYENKIVGECDEFLSQAKAFLDIEGKR